MQRHDQSSHTGCHRQTPFGRSSLARRERPRSRRWPLAAFLAVVAALTPMLAAAAVGPVTPGIAMSAASLAFATMFAVVVLIWRHFARRMLAGMRPRWEDWGR